MSMGVIIVDMLNDFVAGALKCECASKIIPNIQRLLVSARKKEISVIYTRLIEKETV